MHGWALVGEHFTLAIYKLVRYALSLFRLLPQISVAATLQYFMNDLKTYKRILYRFVRMTLALNSEPDVEDVPFGDECIAFYRRWDWWFQLTGIFCG